MSADVTPEPAEETAKPAPISMVEFLESRPPGAMLEISDLMEEVANRGTGGSYWRLNSPPLHIHCDSEKCSGLRYFRYESGEKIFSTGHRILETFLNYKCSNCNGTLKRFSLHARKNDGQAEGRAYKFGELPSFGPVTPPRLLRILGDNREIFMKGRRCESQSLGVGAFVYYRRVVEDQRTQILEQVIRVATTIGASSEMIGLLKQAQAETQFSKSLAMVKDAIPESLRIQGHNPLTLLHDNLSTGIHAKSDEECLEIAGAVRIILAELADRITTALKDEAEITKALGKLLNKNRVAT
jgi:hypothetical protein